MCCFCYTLVNMNVERLPEWIPSTPQEKEAGSGVRRRQSQRTPKTEHPTPPERAWKPLRIKEATDLATEVENVISRHELTTQGAQIYIYRLQEYEKNFEEALAQILGKGRKRENAYTLEIRKNIGYIMTALEQVVRAREAVQHTFNAQKNIAV